jgi:opacity protein-like surface antigen
MGFIGGLQINPSANTALRLEYQHFDSGTVGGSLSFHF